ncbi:MAG: DNA-directed RNA polymerase subunit omega [Limnochordia bacterium]
MRIISAGDMDLKGTSRYTVIVAAAKRARQILEGAKPLVKHSSVKPVTIALEEINDGKVRWHHTKEGIK